MGGFSASFINEIEKMFKKKKAIVVIIMSLAVIVMGQLLVTGVRYQLGPRVTSGNVFPLWVLTVLVNTILPLFTALIAIDLFTGDFSQNVMKIIMVRPATRFKIYTAKVAAVTFFAAANLFIVMILSTITGFIFNQPSVTAAGLGQIVISYAVSLLPIIALAVAIVFFANIFKSGTAVFFLAILLFLAGKALGIVFSQYESFFITSMLRWYELWIADSIPIAVIARQLMIMLGFSIMFFTAGFYLFDKRDL